MKSPQEQLALPLDELAKEKNKNSPAAAKAAAKKKTKKREPATELMKAVAQKVPAKKKLERDFTPEELAEIKAKSTGKEEPEAETEKEAQRRRREMTIKVKNIAKQLELGNRDKVILFPSYSRKKDELEWYKMGDFSALYFVYRMADRMGRRPKLMKDTDKFAKMDAVASTKDVKKLVEQAMKLEEFERYEETLDKLYILYLKKPLTDEEVGILRRTEEMRRETMHNVLRPKQADPKIYQAILVLDRQLLPKVVKMGNGHYAVVGSMMVRELLSLSRVYLNYTNGLIDREEMQTKLATLVDGLMAGVMMLGENEVWTYDVATSMGENINELRKLIKEAK